MTRKIVTENLKSPNIVHHVDLDDLETLDRELR